MDTNTIIWIAQILLALVFLATGLGKLTQAKEKLAEQMGYVEDFSAGTIKLIGLLEVLGALGLIFPAMLPIFPILTPLAGVGLAATMIGAMLTHFRRQEFPMIAGNVVLMAIALFVVYGRFVLVPIIG